MATSRSRTNTLEPPRKSVELQDPGAHDLCERRKAHAHMLMLTPTDASGDDEHFSDASEGPNRLPSQRPSPLSSRPTSPVPRTRVERVDDEPRHGEIPGSSAYETRKQDAVPDELEIVPEGELSKRSSSGNLQPTLSPGDTQIPLMVVEKVDPASPSHGEVPGTAAYEKRQADAAPDIVLKASESNNVPQLVSPPLAASSARSTPVPGTIITRADSIPRLYEESGTATKSSRPNDIRPTLEEHGQPGEGKQ